MDRDLFSEEEAAETDCEDEGGRPLRRGEDNRRGRDFDRERLNRILSSLRMEMSSLKLRRGMVLVLVLVGVCLIYLQGGSL